MGWLNENFYNVMHFMASLTILLLFLTNLRLQKDIAALKSQVKKLNNRTYGKFVRRWDDQ